VLVVSDAPKPVRGRHTESVDGPTFRDALMTDPARRFCPRCGTALVAGLPFCPGCGFNTADVGDEHAPPASAGSPPADALGRSLEAGPSPMTRPDESNAAGARSTGQTSPAVVRQFIDRAPRNTAIVFGALVIAAGLVIFGLLARTPTIGDPASPPEGGSSGPGGQVEPGGSPADPIAPIVGLTIESPRDGQAVATKEVTVIGIAPPGLTITRDISFGLDQHATTDGTGHWAINVGLDEGENNLVFRIGDDHSTEKRVRVIYAPPPAP